MANSCGIMVSAGPDITICAGVGKILNGSVINSTDYQWDPPDGLSNSKIQKPTATPSMTTTYTLTAKAMSGNIIVNGNFETGSLAPSTSQYTMYTDLNTWAMSTGGYMVLSVPQIAAQFGCNPNIGAFAMAITPTGSASDIWCQTKPVNPNTDYKITFKLIGIPYIFGSPPSIGVKVNGTLIGSIEPTSGFCTETDASFVWNSGASVSANFCLANYGGTGTFAICAIDDIAVKECCVEKDEVTVTVYDVSIDVAPPDEINCLNKPITIDASASSQGAGITYDWSTKNGHIVSGDKTLKPVVDTPGTYTLKLTGLYGCEKQIDVIVNGSVTKPDIKTSSTDIDCLNSTGSIDATSKSNSPQYEWNGPNGYFSSKAKNINLKEPGEYIVKVTDSYGCESTAKVEIKDNRTDLEAEIAGDSITCSKDSAVLKANSIAVKPIYKWFSVSGYKKDSSTFAVVKDTGWYFLQTTDSSGCKELDSFYVKNLQNSIPVSIAAADTLTCNVSTVIINLQADSTSIFQWSGPKNFSSNLFHPTVSDSGWYSVKVITKDGCTGLDSVFIHEDNSRPDLEIKNDTLHCFNKILLDGNSLTAGATFEWKDKTGTLFKSRPEVQDTGTWLFSVTSPNGCTVSKSFQVLNITDTLDVSFIRSQLNLTCRDSVITAEMSANGPYKKLLWMYPGGNDTSYKISINKAGTYTLFTSNDFCTSIDSFNVLDLRNNLNLNYNADSLDCNHLQATIHTTVNQSNVIFSWNGPGNFNDNSQNPVINIAGDYTVIATDTGGCQITKIISVFTDTSKLQISATSDSISCLHNSVIPVVTNDSNAILYNWIGPGGFTSPLKNPTLNIPGNYFLTVKGKNGCDTTIGVTVPADIQKPSATLESDTIQCKSTANIRALNISPGAIIQWTGPNGFKSNQPITSITESGFYVLTLTAANGCTSQDSIFVFQKDKLPDIFANDDTLSCAKQKLFLNGGSATPGVSFVWTGPNGFKSTIKNPEIQDSGVYTLKVTDVNGCEALRQIYIFKNSEVPILNIIQSNNQISCKDSVIQIILSANQKSKITIWSGPGGFQSNADSFATSIPGLYHVAFTNEFGCIAQDSFSIQDIRKFPNVNVADDSLNCIRTKIKLQASTNDANLVFQWTGPNQFTSMLLDPSVQFGGMFLLLVKDTINDCSVFKNIFVKSDTVKPDLSLSADSITCLRSSAPVKAGSSLQGFTMKWTGPNGFNYTLPQFATKVPGRYICTITNPRSGCSTTNFVDVIEDTSRIKDVMYQLSNASCNLNNGKISILHIDGGKPPYRFSTDSGITFIPNLNTLDFAAGKYNILVEDQNGCKYSISAIIDENKSIQISLPQLIQLKISETSSLHLNILTDTSTISKIIWNPSDQLSCNDCLDPVLTGEKDELITVTVIDKDGCIDTASIQLNILRESKFYFPNTFSPNGDNINDFFYPIGINSNSTVSYLNIYDRWGNLVFQKKDFIPGIEQEGWNGRSNNQQKVNPGVYVYVAEIMDQGKAIRYTGSVTIIQ